MKKIAVYLSLQFLTSMLFAQNVNYFLADNGSDSNNGTSVNSPFKTIRKLNTIVLEAGSTVYFKKGDTFKGELKITASGSKGKPITFDAYGVGNAPVISGTVPVTGWRQVKSNMWEATLIQAPEFVTGLYKGSVSLPLGRFPNLKSANSGYLTVRSHIGRTSLTGENAINKSNWVGGEVVYKPEQWVIERGTITAQTDSTLTFNGKNASYDVKDKWGFFIQNHPATLDLEGEWCYDKSTSKITLYSTQNPTGTPIDAAVYDGIHLNNVRFVTIKNIKIASTLHHAILAENISNVVIENNVIENAGENGITVVGPGQNLTIKNNIINTAYNNGVDVNGPSSFVFTDNILKNIGLIPGRGKGKDLQYFAVLYINPTNAGQALIQNNTIDSIAYCGIRFQSSHIIIRHNVISNFNLIKTDGGAIYTFNNTAKKQKPYIDQYIDSNVVSNGHVSFEGTSGKYPESNSNGVYLDFGSQNVHVLGNTIFNCPSSAIYLIGTNHIDIQNNNCYNNGAALFLLDKPFPNLHDNVVKNNKFYAKTASQSLIRLAVKADADIPVTSSFSNNAYSNFDGSPIRIKNSQKTYALSLDNWQKNNQDDDKQMRFKKQVHGLEKNTKLRTQGFVNQQDAPADSVLFYYNSSKVAKTFPLNGNYKDDNDKAYSGSVVLQPFTSVILTKK